MTQINPPSDLVTKNHWDIYKYLCSDGSGGGIGRPNANSPCWRVERAGYKLHTTSVDSDSNARDVDDCSLACKLKRNCVTFAFTDGGFGNNCYTVLL